MLLALKELVSRHPALKRFIRRLIASIPMLDLWVRNRITVSTYTPSPLQIDARHLPDEARAIHELLLARLEIDSVR